MAVSMSSEEMSDETIKTPDLPDDVEGYQPEEAFVLQDYLPGMEDENSPPPFEFTTENVYIIERATSRDGKRSKRMMCSCQFDPETDSLSEACGDDCLNRLLMIECGSRCPCGEYCNNKRFTRKIYANVEVIKTERKGWGLKANRDITPYSFVMEYCGEVCTLEEFEIRRSEYEKEKRKHYYFMSLKADEILDATKKGNLSRFINHSCDPNCETQKWTVSGRLRVGFFALRLIPTGEELTFDYQFQRFGESAQKCYCGSENCRGYLGAAKQNDSAIRSDMFVPSLINTRERKVKRRGDDVDLIFEREIYDVVGSTWRLRNADQVLSFSRLMLRAESLRQRTMLLKVVQATKDMVCLKRFLSLQGLRLLWTWMVELTNRHTTEALETRMQILLSLNCLPIPNKNLLMDNKIWAIVQKWAEHKTTSHSHINHEIDESIDQESVVISEADCSISQESEGKENEKTEEISKESIDQENGRIKTDEKLILDIEHINQCKEDEIKSDNDGADSIDVLFGISSEAEGREAVAIIEDEESKIVSVATDLLVKWSSLKEVFRIPKKVIPISNEQQLKQKRNDDDNFEIKRKRKRESRWESIDEDHVVTKEKLSPTNGISPKASCSVHVARTGLLGSSPVGFPSLQNTLIVQNQSGQSVYVQQQIFPSGPPVSHGLVSAQYAPVHFPPSHLPPLQPIPVTTTADSFYHCLSSAPKTDVQSTPLPPPPPAEKLLLPNWKEAKEASGKVYYYHTITRRTQWDRPTEEDRDGEIMMDLATPEIDEEDDIFPSKGQPHTPEESPPSSPLSEECDRQSTGQKKHSTAPKDLFKHSISKLIVRCLDHHRKPNCKYGRITCSEDFKHLARKLTFGIIEKEVTRRGGSAEVLEFNDQVKSRTKAYIKNYMKKFGPIYSHS